MHDYYVCLCFVCTYSCSACVSRCLSFLLLCMWLFCLFVLMMMIEEIHRQYPILRKARMKSDNIPTRLASSRNHKEVFSLQRWKRKRERSWWLWMRAKRACMHSPAASPISSPKPTSFFCFMSGHLLLSTPWMPQVCYFHFLNYYFSLLH